MVLFMTNHDKLGQTDINRENLHRLVYAEIGRLLLHYQHIELMLKMLLPHIKASEKLALESNTKDVGNLLDSKETMGILVEKLKSSIDASQPEKLSSYVAQVTANRNELVHKFTTLDFGSLASETKCEEAIAYLRRHHEFALPLRELLVTFLQSYIDTFDENADNLNGSNH